MLQYLSFNTIFYASFGKPISKQDPICIKLMKLINDTFDNKILPKQIMTDKFPFLKLIPSFNNASIKCKKID